MKSVPRVGPSKSLACALQAAWKQTSRKLTEQWSETEHQEINIVKRVMTEPDLVFCQTVV
jgi:hypothetical protein